MEFWGVEVKPGQSLKVTPEDGKLIHISQAALDVVKDVKGAKYVPLKLKIDSQNFVIGTLSAENTIHQMMFDLVFEKEFELSHGWKDGSVFFVGYVAEDPVSDGDDDEDDEEIIEALQNGMVKPKTDDAKADKAVTKKDEESDSDEEGDDSIPSDEDLAAALNESDSADSSDESEDEDDSSSDEEETPKKVQQSKKRQAEPAQATPAKKAKAATPEKTGNKKGHTGTPFPAKSAGKSSPAGNKSNQQSPKSGGNKSGGNRPFNNKGQKSNGKGKNGRK